MNLIYIANIRVPTEKAHGLQIMQNCEALADAGASVELWAARRVNTSELRAIPDVFAHYGVKHNFTLRRLICLDLLWLVPDRTDALAKLIFALQWITFTLAAFIRAAFTRADVFYSRDPLILLVLSLIKPRKSLTYEAHSASSGHMGKAIQRATVRRVGTVFATTRALADDLIALGADASRTFVAHDGVRAARFANLPGKAEARREIGWDEGAFIVGYVGRLQTMAMDKGVGALVEALAQVGGCSLALVGGPDDHAAALKARWIELGQPESTFLYAGQVPPDDVPRCLTAFDVCAMPFPETKHFAYYMSPLKLFEYMAAGRPVIASDLPSVREVVAHDESALLIGPANVDDLAAAVRRLRDDPALRERLGSAAQKIVMDHYTWASRAKMILEKIRPWSLV